MIILNSHIMVWFGLVTFSRPMFEKNVVFQGQFRNKMGHNCITASLMKKILLYKKLHNLVLEMLHKKIFHPKLTGREIFTLEVCSILAFLGGVFSTKTVFYSL